MNVVKILMGLFFGAWAVGVLVLGVGDLKAPLSSSLGLFKLAAVVAPSGILALMSVWCFQSAFRERDPSADETDTVDVANSDQPQSPISSDQPDG